MQRTAPIAGSLLLASAALLGGCPADAPEDAGTTDRKAYAASAALLGSDPAAAAGECGKIQDPVLAGDCATFAAKAMAKRKLDPLPVCGAIQQIGWQQVCFFESVDAAGLFGEKAVQACHRAGSFRQRCLSHALGRETDREWRVVKPGQELDFLAWLDETMPVYGLDTTVENIPRDFLAKRIAARVAGETTGQPPRRFSRADCGEIPDETCQEVYRFYVRRLFRQQDMGALCGQSLVRETIEAAGLPGWEDDFADAAPGMWMRLCRELKGGGKPPRGQH